jgi:hypothetical protein
VTGLPAEAVPEIPAPTSQEQPENIGKKTRIDRQAVRQDLEENKKDRRTESFV